MIKQGGVGDPLVCQNQRPKAKGCTAPFNWLIKTTVVEIDVVYKKIQIFNFFGKAQKRSKLSENDIYIYLRLFPKYGAKVPSKKKVMGVQS